MLRRRLQSQLQLLALQRLVGGALPTTATGAVVTGAAAAAAVPPAATTATTASAQLRPLRWFAAEAEPEHSPELTRAAHELGLDAVPLGQLRAIMDPVRPKLQAADSFVSVSGGPPKQRKLTYQDLQGYTQWVEALKDSPADYSDSMPTGPVVDATQWLEANFKEVGWTMEPRGPFYVWRAWAAAHLPKEQYETLVCVHEVMSDESTRSTFVKQAQHELARLWDWQQRRAALGLSPDLPRVSIPAAAAAAVAGSSSSSGGAASIPAAEPHAAAAAGGELPLEFVQAAAAEEQEEEAEEGEEEAHSSSSSSDEDAAAAATAVWDPLDPAAMEEFANKDVLDVLEEADALEAAAAAAAAEAAEAAAARAFFEVPDVVDAAPRRQQQQQQRSGGLRLNGRSAGRAVEDVQWMLKRGQETARKGQFVQRVSVPLREYKPVAHDGDIFLPTHPLGNRKVAEVLADPARTRPVNPDKVVQQAAWVVAAAQRASAAGGSSSGLGVTTAAGVAAAGGAVGTWTSMPLLDRTVLFEQELRVEAERLAAKPKRALPWQLLDDGYTFDLQTRPPTQTLDLLTSYLEVKYADVLLQKDAVQTTNRQLALQTLQQNQASGGGFASELLEQPPAALMAAKTLSPAEREAVSKTLDDLLGAKQYSQYREAVLQLYCDGLVSWGELQECWAAAQAGEELTAAAEAPVKFADDRQQLFNILSGQQQLPSQALRHDSSSSSSSSGPAASAAEQTAAARQVWEQAASQLQASWAAAGSSGSSSDAWWVTGDGAAAATVSYEEAEQTWQQLLVLAGQPDGPRFDQVLLSSSSSSSSSSSRDDGLEQQLQQLQAGLQRAFGLEQQQVQELAGVGSSSDSVGPGELSTLQQLFAAPPTLEQVLQQRWQQVAEQELGQELSGPGRAVSQEGGPNWPQMWMLLQQVAAQQQQQPGTAAAAAGSDAAAQFEKHVREADGVALTPPPYPGARRLLRWEQRLMLHVASGQEVLPAELKVKLGVSAAELAQETGLSEEGLQYLLAVAGERYTPLTGDLTIACDRFPTREENRRWCLEVLHRLLQVAQGRHPSKHFWVDSSVLGVPAGNPVPSAKAAPGAV